MEKRVILFVLLAILLATCSFPVEFNLIASYNYNDSYFTLYNDPLGGFFDFDATLKYEAKDFAFLVSVYTANNKIYNEPISQSYYAGFYFDMKNALISFKNDCIKISFGRTHLNDIVDSPYSLFVSSSYYPRNVLEFLYEDEQFIYVTRWLELNNLLNQQLDPKEKYRSSNYKLYAVKFGNARFGYQEVNMYVGKNFDFEYFFSPMPGFFIQYVNSTGRPFSEGMGEANFIMGFFIDYLTDDKYAYAQILIDDINMNRFLHPTSYQNPDKIAWSFGTNFKTKFGRFGLYHAAATKYTFQPSSESGNPAYYGYTYFPSFTYTVDNKTVIFPAELLYAGYKYGENNVAFLVEYANENLKLSTEYVVLGERSPVNPWGEQTTYLEGTHLLDDEVLEHRLLTMFSYNYNFSGLINLFMNTSLGYIWNKSKLVNVESDNIKKPLLRPQIGNNVVHFSLSLGLSVKISF